MTDETSNSPLRRALRYIVPAALVMALLAAAVLVNTEALGHDEQADPVGNLVPVLTPTPAPAKVKVATTKIAPRKRAHKTRHATATAPVVVHAPPVTSPPTSTTSTSHQGSTDSDDHGGDDGADHGGGSDDD